MDTFLGSIQTFEIFDRWLCRKFQVLLRLQSTDTDKDVHVCLPNAH